MTFRQKLATVCVVLVAIAILIGLPVATTAVVWHVTAKIQAGAAAGIFVAIAIIATAKSL